MKKCVSCSQEKPLSEYYAHDTAADGFRSDCKECHKAKAKARYASDVKNKRAKNMEAYWRRKEKNPEMWAIIYARNREKSLASSKQRYLENRAERIAKAVEWAKNNRCKANANIKAYKMRKIQACPSWLTKDEMFLISEAYELAALRTQMFGFPWHVDHIVPLRGKEVSGLHVPWNLQVIPGVENQRKSNRCLD